MSLISQISTDKRFVMGFITLLLTCFAKATTYEVSSDGNYDFTSIQEAIDIAIDNDTILVHPGTYYENISINSKNISLQSTYYLTDNSEDIENTFISGDPDNSAIRVENSESVTIQGFKISNNYLRTAYIFPEVSGGGILVDDSHVDILNCSVLNSISRGGSGLMVSNNSEVFVSGLNVYNNLALYHGGGLSIEESYIQFDNENKCSIYNNYAGGGMDIFVMDCNESQNFCMNISLELVSQNINQPDEYYFRAVNMNEVLISAEDSYFNHIESDLYISVEGDDSNSGMTPDESLITIAYAMNIIASDSLNQRSIYISPGTYSFTNNQQIFPFACKSYINLVGNGEVVLDLEGDGLLTWLWQSQNTMLSNIRIINGYMHTSSPPI